MCTVYAVITATIVYGKHFSRSFVLQYPHVHRGTAANAILMVDYLKTVSYPFSTVTLNSTNICKYIQTMDTKP